MYKNGSDFLNKLYKNMHLEDVVMHTADKSDTPEEKITKYLERLEKVHDKAKIDEHKMDLLKELYYDKYVIKELPESYINLQKKIAREEGYGNFEVTEEIREELLKHIQDDQKKSLASWIEYLSSDDSTYPIWFKNYVFQGMLKLGDFNKEKGEFRKRTNSTTNPYLELNREVLAQVYNTLAGEVEGKELTDEQVKALENGISFKKIYTYYLTKQNYKKEENKSNEGIWVKYDQGSDSKKLCDTLQGKNTGWCTAGYETAKSQLEDGDFYIYYTKDNNNEYTEPRIAIRMEGQDEIAEVRGVGVEQNLESEMIDIADKKLDEFPDKEKYSKKVHDMKKLTEIDYKTDKNLELTQEELQFLYEIDYQIDGFGWDEDPRIEEIKERRNELKDLNLALSNIDKLEGDLYLGLKTAEGLKLPEEIGGSLDLMNLRTTEGLELPKKIGGDLVLSGLTTAEGLKLPEEIGGDLDLMNLRTTEGLELPKKIGGDLVLSGLTTAEGLKLPKKIGQTLYLGRLTTAEGLELPEEIGQSLDLSSLTTTEGLELPEEIGKSLFLGELTPAEGLKLPKKIGGSLALWGLPTAEDLKMPESYRSTYILLPDNISEDDITFVPDEEYFGEKENENSPKSIK